MKYSALHTLPKLRTLMTMPCTAVGVGMTCRSLLHAAAGAGLNIDLFTSRYDDPSVENYRIHSFMPRMLGYLPYGLGKHLSESWLHRSFVASVDQGEIAYLWPSVPLAVYEILAKRGTVILTEAINTRMPTAKRILDEAYDSLGLRPVHGITDERIAEQTARYDLSTAIFAPSPATEAALSGSSLANRFVPTSYGTWVPEHPPTRAPRKPGQQVRFLFVGGAGIRKGAHLLLDAWKRAPANAHLRIVGDIELPIRKLYGDVLSQDNVSCAGFRANVGPEYRAADVFILPSLEEGDPIVTYEAAAHNLPIIASPMGAGRIGAETGCVRLVEPRNTDELLGQICAFGFSEDLRRDWADKARAASRSYDWSVVAPRRFARLKRFLEINGKP